MKTLKDAIEAKQKLEQDILALVREFETEYGLYITDIESCPERPICSLVNRTIDVRVKVEV